MQAAAALGGALRVVVRAGHCGQGLEVVRRAGLVPASAARDSPSVRCSAAPLRSPRAWLLSARSYSEMRMDSRSDARRAAVRPLVNGRAAASGSPLVSRTCPRKLYTWATASARKYAACRSCAPASDGVVADLADDQGVLAVTTTTEQCERAVPALYLQAQRVLVEGQRPVKVANLHVRAEDPRYV